MTDTILAATRAALVQNDGQSILIKPGATARAGHPIVEAYPGLFEPLVVQFDVEDSTETADASPADDRAPKPARNAKPSETR
jgi:hypothetical protein